MLLVAPVPPPDALARSRDAVLAAMRALPYQSFAWQPARTKEGHVKAVWTGPGRRDPLYGADAEAALAAGTKGGGDGGAYFGRLRKVAAVRRNLPALAAVPAVLVGTAVGVPLDLLGTAADVAGVHNSTGDPLPWELGQAAGRAAWSAARGGIRRAATLGIGKGAGRLVRDAGGEIGDAAVGLDRWAGRNFDRLARHIGATGVAAADNRVGRLVGRVASAIDIGGMGAAMAHKWGHKLNTIGMKLRSEGLLAGGWAGFRKTMFPYYGAAFRANQKRFGTAGAHAIEAATILLNTGLSYGLPAVGASAGQLLGGPAAAAAGAYAGAWAQKGVNAALNLAGTTAGGGAGRAAIMAVANRARRAATGSGPTDAQRRVAARTKQRRKAKLMAVPNAALAAGRAAKAAAGKLKRKGPPPTQHAERFAETGSALADAVARLRAGTAAVTRQPLPPVPPEAVRAALLMAAADLHRGVFAPDAPPGGVETFAWQQGKRGGRYWLPKGKPDIPANRLYGKAGEKAAGAGNGGEGVGLAPSASPSRGRSRPAPPGPPPTRLRDFAAELVIQGLAKAAGLTAAIGSWGGAGAITAANPTWPFFFPDSFHGLITLPFGVHDAVEQHARYALGGGLKSPHLRMSESAPAADPLAATVTAIRRRLADVAAGSGQPAPALTDDQIRALLARTVCIVARSASDRPAEAIDPRPVQTPLDKSRNDLLAAMRAAGMEPRDSHLPT